MGGFPTQRSLEFFLAGHQNCRIPGPARSELAGDFAAGDAFRRVDDFENGEAAAVPDIEGFAGNAVDGLERAEVGIGNVKDVYVIADASAVGGGIVRAENIDVRQISGGGVQDARDEMRLDTMMLAELLRGAGGIEITKHGILQTGIGAIVRENLFEYELGFAVRIDGRFGMVLGNGDDFRFAIGGGGGRKDEFLHAVAGDGVQQIHAAGYVGSVEDAGFADGLGDEGFRGEVHHRVNLVLGEDVVKLRTIGEVQLEKGCARRHGGAMAFDEAVHGDDAHAAREQDFGADAADVSRGSGNKNIHR